MFRKGCRKNVAAMIVAHEVERVTRRGRESGANGSLARIGNRSGRQSGMKISVIGRIKIQIASGNRRERALEHVVIEASGINHRGIAGKLHVVFKTAGENTRDNGAFEMVGRLLFHQ